MRAAVVGDNVAGVGLGGSVTLAGDCLGINQMAVIWPHGTTVVDTDPLTITVPGVGSLSVGDHVSGGGADFSFDHLPDGIDEVPSGCTTSGRRIMEFFRD